ncbi:2-oxoacid:acceptor oxidoreductase family protein [Natronospora cellulosivora (SeqCode)]
MYQEIVIAGFGGQGLMLLGRLLAFAAMKKELHVTWLPSYGPEMRGGTAHCTVIISTEKIPSPISTKPDTLIVMNQPSLDKFEPTLKKDASIYVNTSLIENITDISNKNLIKIPANKMAIELGSSKVANMLMLGAYIADNDFLDMETVKEALASVLSDKKRHLIPINEKALDKGRKINMKLAYA